MQVMLATFYGIDYISFYCSDVLISEIWVVQMQVALAKELVERCIYSQLSPQGGH